MDISLQDIYDYIYVSQGKTKVESIDDNEELGTKDSHNSHRNNLFILFRIH